MLAVGGDDGRIRLLDPRLRTASVEHVLKAHTGPVQAVAVTPTDGVKVRRREPPSALQQMPRHKRIPASKHPPTPTRSNCCYVRFHAAPPSCEISIFPAWRRGTGATKSSRARSV